MNIDAEIKPTIIKQQIFSNYEIEKIDNSLKESFPRYFRMEIVF